MALVFGHQHLLELGNWLEVIIPQAKSQAGAATRPRSLLGPPTKEIQYFQARNVISQHLFPFLLPLSLVFL